MTLTIKTIAAAAVGLAATTWGPAALAQPEGIHVVAGTYGASCGVRWGNVTQDLAATCDGRWRCEYRVDVNRIGDPAPGCRKDYVARWRCPSGRIRTTSAPPEAGYGAVVRLSCGRD